MEARGHRRRTSRARHVPDDIPGGGHVQDASHDQHEHRTPTGTERQEQDHPGSGQGGDRTHRSLQGPDRGQPSRGRPSAAGRGSQHTENDDVCGQAGANNRARRPGLG